MADLEHRHVTAHSIDRHVAGLVSPDERAVFEKQECGVCRSRLDEARLARDRFLARNPPAERARALLSEAARPSRWPRRWSWWVPVLSAGCALVVVLAVGKRGHDERPSVIDKGGGATVGFSVKPRGEANLRPGRDNESLRAGDAVQLHLQPGTFTQAHVFSIDEHGRPRTLFDWRSGVATDALPSLVLDGSLRPERIVVVFHDGDVDLAAIERGEAPGSRVTVRSILIQKAPPTSQTADSGRP
jgi:hypothetical protein